MITILVTCDGDGAALGRTLDSLKGQSKEFQKEIRLRILNKGGKMDCPACAGIADTIFVDTGSRPETEIFREQMDMVQTPFVTMIAAGEYYLGNALELGCRLLMQERDKTDAVLLQNVGRRVSAPKHVKAAKAENNGKQSADTGNGAEGKQGTDTGNEAAGKQMVAGKVFSLDKAEDILKMPGCMRGIIFCTEAFRGIDFSCASKTCFAEILNCRILMRKKTAAFVKGGYFSGDAALSDVDEPRTAWEEEAWYLDVVENYCLPILEEFRGKNGSIPLFIQAQVLFALRIVFLVNMNNKNKGVLAGGILERYLVQCSRCLQDISNRLVSAADSTHSERRFDYMHWSAFMCLKYRNASDSFYIKGERPQLFCRNEGINQETGFEPFVTVDLMEYEDGIWRVDCAVERFLTELPLRLYVSVNKVPIPVRYVPRFSEIRFFGETIVDKAAFTVEIPIKDLKDKNKIEFVLTDLSNKHMVLPAAALVYQSKVTSLLKNSYWCFDKYMVTFGRSGKQISGILIRKKGKAGRIRQELALMKEILRAAYGSKRMFAIRCLYWLVYPLYSGKNIWITFDKLYKGGDCGEYFYKYMESRKKDGVTPAYVIKADAPDYKRLRQEGYEPLAYRSLKQRLFYLYADIVFATHSSVHSFCGFSKWEVRFVQDRLRAVNTCIQHGLSVQDLTFDSNRIVNNNKRYYCASRYEVENLSRPAYDYAPGVLKLTGIPRYDGLVNQDRKQILITPTWRSYIAMPAVMGSSRPYNPDFRNTDYYKIFQELLENRRLAETAGKTGYRVIYLLHPIISAQKDDFRPGKGIELVSALDINYEQILTQSSLMVTDYSGVQFDFAYMRKPVVYFHPPKLPPHYEEGGFFYDTQGFGEICEEVDELIDVLCDYMESGCKLKDFYRTRQDDFFAYNDHENCKRIYEDAREMQRCFV